MALVKVGYIFELPENVIRKIGTRGNIRNPEETKVIARYEVVEIEEEGQKVFKGRVIVTYGNRRIKKDI